MVRRRGREAPEREVRVIFGKEENCDERKNAYILFFRPFRSLFAVLLRNLLVYSNLHNFSGQYRITIILINSPKAIRNMASAKEKKVSTHHLHLGKVVGDKLECFFDYLPPAFQN